MHLLASQPGVVAPLDQAVDLEHEPADIVFLSAADTELTTLALAHQRMGRGRASLRLANLSQLQHPFSVDLYLQRTLAASGLVVARLLGGRGYWEYGVDELSAAARGGAFRLALLPGCASPDRDLMAYSSLPMSACERMWHYFTHGGLDNAEHFLSYCNYLLERVSAAPPRAKAVPRAGVLTLDTEAGASTKYRATIVFYRAMVLSGQTEPIAALAAKLARSGVRAEALYVASLKESDCAELVRQRLKEHAPHVIINTTGFALSSHPDEVTVLDEPSVPVVQAMVVGSDVETWRESAQGLPARDLAMQVALPELDGRIITRPCIFKRAQDFDARLGFAPVVYDAQDDRIAWVAQFAANWSRLGAKRRRDRRIALVVSNYPGDAGSIGTAVGLDTPASVANIMSALRRSGYDMGGGGSGGGGGKARRGDTLPADAPSVVACLMPSHPDNAERVGEVVLRRARYESFFATLPRQHRHEVTRRWGHFEDDRMFMPAQDGFVLNAARYGNVVLAVQPPRVWLGDRKSAHHDTALPPHHGYLAFYAWLRREFEADAIVHVGKHGSSEWLPGKAVGLSAWCWPELVLGAVPLIYPFIVNDPGEGAQAKRRAHAVIISHLTPPLRRAGAHGDIADLEHMVDEYYQAQGGDPARAAWLLAAIVERAAKIGIAGSGGDAPSAAQHRNGSSNGSGAANAGRHLAGNGSSLAGNPLADLNERMSAIDNFLCDLKSLQIRGGLHRFGDAPADTVVDEWMEVLGGESAIHDTAKAPQRERQSVKAAMLHIQRSGEAELSALLSALDGKFIRPSPSGAPSRGRLDVLPTGRNFFTVDPRAVPTRAAWALARESAQDAILHYSQRVGEWPRQFALSLWGTANMRTGGDDVAQALAFLGVQPLWDGSGTRVTGVRVLPLSEIGRPRVDVLCRVSGLFRDAFDRQIRLITEAVAAVAVLNEPASGNPVAARVRARLAAMGGCRAALPSDGSELPALPDFPLACMSVFSARPGSYGSGIDLELDHDMWHSRDELADKFASAGCFGYTSAYEAVEAGEQFATALAATDVAIHNLDNREFDILDSGDFAAFQGGMAAAVERVKGEQPMVLLADHSNPQATKVRNLHDEITLVVLARASNPRWIEPTLAHGYRGVAELAQTLRNLSNYAALTDAVDEKMFNRLFDAWLLEDKMRETMRNVNAVAYRQILDLFRAAIARGYWQPKRNSTRSILNLEESTA